MLCSRCSVPVKPVVAIDIDGTLADYHGHFAQFSCEYLAMDIEGAFYTGAVPYWSWWCDTFDADRTTFRQVKLAYRQGGQKRLQPVYRGARDLVVNLRGMGVEVWLTTTRPHDRFDRIDPDTRQWLARHAIEFDGLLYHDEKMSELSERVTGTRVAAVLDDQEDVLMDASRRNWPAILRKTKYNRDLDWEPFVLNLEDAYETIKTYIDVWRRRNG